MLSRFNRQSLIVKLFVIALAIIAISIVWYQSQKVPELPKMTVQEKKARFKSLIVPAVDTVYAQLMERYQQVKSWIASGENANKIALLKKEYKVETDQALLMAIKPHPKSIAIAQAAMESSWATSRFFLQANNVFGVWSYNENEPRIAALEKRGDKTIWVKKYPDVEAAIFDYYKTLGRSHAFDEFRQSKMTTDDPFALVKKLGRYSEKGSEYGDELAEIIEYNHFDTYDSQ